MKRKVIKLAQNTFVVSLPSVWCKNNSIVKGQELDIEILGKGLHISNKKEYTNTTHSINSKKNAQFAAREVNLAYKRGIDELYVSFTDPSVLKEIKKELEILIGYELVREGKNNCLIRSIASGSAEELKPVKQKIWHNLLDFAHTATTAAKNQNWEELKSSLQAEEIIDKLTNFCKRLITLNPNPETHNTLMQYAIVREQEQIADLYEKLFSKVLAKQKITKKETEMLIHANKLLEKIAAHSMKPSEDSINEYMNAKKENLIVINSQLGIHISQLISKIDDIAGPVINYSR